MTASPAESTSSELAIHAGKYLTFTLHEESYGIPVLKIREIIRHMQTTAVPQMPSYVRGVINLRGKIVPVVDLRTKFGLPDQSTTDQTCIVVVEVTRPDGRLMQMGLVVDTVEEVANIGAGDIEPAPDFGTQVDTAYILGMAKVKGRVKTLLDINRVVTGQALDTLGAAMSLPSGTA